MDDATLDAMLAVNIRAPHVLTAAVVPGMLARGSGAIVNVGSWVATVGLPVGALYSATKAAIEQLTRAWAAEFGPSGIRVNAISPGVPLTEGNAAHRKTLEQMVAGTPAGRMGAADEIAAGVVFLVGDDAAFVHGANLVVDGGAVATRLR